MNPKKRHRQATPIRKRLTTRFSPSIVMLEDRVTPATFYVDPNAFDQGGGLYTFNKDLPGQTTDLVLGTDIFLDFNSGLAQANATAGLDTLRLAYFDIPVDNSAGTVVVTDSVNIVGSGSGATRVLPTSDTAAEFGSDGAVIRVDTAGTQLNISDVTLDGNSPTLLVGSFVRYENGATGNVTRTSSLYTVYTPDNLNSGAAFVATGPGTVLNVSNSSLAAYGAVGIGYQLGATGSVTGNTFSGGGLGNFVIYGVQVTDNSQNVLISGNIFSDHTGVVGDAASAAVLVTSYDIDTDTFATASATIVGNTITSNVVGIIVGVLDSSSNPDTGITALIQHNNIIGNDTAIVTDTTNVVNALYNWWGDVTGPFASGNTTTAGDNLTSIGNPVGPRTLWRDTAIIPFSGILQGKTPVIAATSPTNYRDQLNKADVTVTAVTVTPTNDSPVQFKIQFSEAVSAFDLTDITVTSAVGGTPVLVDSGNNPVTATTRDSVYFVNITGMTGTGNISVNVPASTTGGDTLPTIRTDLFGGTNAAGAAATVLFDNVSPTITVSSPNGPLPVTVTAAPTGFLVTFSEPVTGFTASDLVLSGSGSTGVTASVTPADATGTVYNVSLSGLSQTGIINVAIAAAAATDLAGNPSAALTTTAVIDFNPPFGRGFAAGGDVGTAQPFFGVDDELAVFTGIFPFEADYTGGVRVASIDMNGDGTLDIIVGSGLNRRAEIRVFDGLTTKLLGRTEVFESTFNLGVFVSAGDFNGDGVPDIVVTPDSGGSARVTIFDGKTFLSTNGAAPVTLANFFAFPDDTNYRGGARSGVGDIDNDGINDLVIGAGFGGGPRVAAFGGATLGLAGGPRLFNDYFAFSPEDALTLRNGVFVAVGDINGDGFADVTTGAGDGGGPRVQTYSGKDLLSNSKVRLADFFAATVTGGESNRGGSRVAIKDMDGDSKLDIIVSPGLNGNAKIGVFYGNNPNLIPPGGVLAADNVVDLFGNFNNGVFVG
jgi:hypothetical protein